jgi:hypothetical protein
MIAALVALAVSAAPLADPGPHGLPIWRGAQVGMAPSDVRAVFPGVQPVSDGEALLDNAKERLRLDGVRLPGGEAASARFYFRGESLNEVRLLVDAPVGATAANVARARAVADRLAVEFGKPVACGPREGLLAYQCDWLSKGLSVSVTYMDVAGQSPLLDVTLRAVGGADAPPARAEPVTRSRGPAALRPAPAPPKG